MKDWRDKRMIDYLEGFNAELPQSDWDDFLSRKAVEEVYPSPEAYMEHYADADIIELWEVE